MKERGILFSAPMVRALLAGTKTQTRRIMNPQPWFDTRYGTARGMAGAWIYGSLNERRDSDTYGGPGDRWTVHFDEEHQSEACTSTAYGWGARAGCPYGVPGDRLWVRETWQYFDDSPEGHDLIAVPRGRLGPAAPWTGCQGSRSITWRAAYRADGEISHPVSGAARWRSPIHMPRWASRITLEVTEVRVQRLQDISEEDAKAEGPLFAMDEEQTVLFPHLTAERNKGCVACRGDGRGISELCHDSLRGKGRPFACWYATLWDAINGAGSWDANPWIWAISFRRLP